MGLTGFVVSILLLAAAALAASRLKSKWLRSLANRYSFKPEPLDGGPLVSIIIPAKNEEANLPGLLESVLSQRYRTIEVIIVDDSSTDRTRKVAREFAAGDTRVRVVEARDLPEGWTGKCHACSEGIREARGEYLLQVDCDVRLKDPDVIGGLVSYAQSNDVDLYSVIPQQRLVGFAERLLGPAVYTIMGLAFMPLKKVNDPNDPKAAAVGQCLFFKRSSYEAVGGHEAVKRHIAEDIAIAKLIKSQGMRLALHHSRGAVSVRMYTSAAEIWQGWSRHIYRSAAGGFGGFLAIEVVFALAFLVPPVVLVWSILSLLWAPTIYAAVIAVIAGGIDAVLHAARIGKYRSFGWPVAWEPAFAPAMVFALALLADSAIKHTRVGGLAWKGRRYAGDKFNR